MKRWINCMIWFLAVTHLPSLEAFGDNNGNFTRDEKMSIFNVVRNNNNNIIDLFTRGRSSQCCCCFDGCICCLGEIPQQCLCRHIRLQWNLLQVLIQHVIIDHPHPHQQSTSSLPSSSSSECEAAGGTASGTCASSFGVCCVFRSPVFVKPNYIKFI